MLQSLCSDSKDVHKRFILLIIPISEEKEFFLHCFYLRSQLFEFSCKIKTSTHVLLFVYMKLCAGVLLDRPSACQKIMNITGAKCET